MYPQGLLKVISIYYPWQFSGMLLPIFRRKRILHILNELVKKSKITAFQKKQIWLIIKDSMCYQSIFTKIGALRFLTFNIYGVAVIFAWNTIESTVWNVMHGDGLIPQVITGTMFFLAIWIADLIDKKVANEIKKEHKITEQSQSKMEKIYGEKYQVIVKLMEDVGGGSTETSKVGGILLEETIDDIKDIIDLSSSKKEAKIKRDLSKKSKIKKGKNEKVKMFGISLDKKKKKKTIHVKKSKKKKRKTPKHKK